jgi:hypothetical protein
MHRRIREIETMIRQAGLQMDGTSPAKTGGVYRVIAKAANGQMHTFFVSEQPGGRADKNNLADMRRFAAKNPGTLVGSLGSAMLNAARKEHEPIKHVARMAPPPPPAAPEPSPTAAPAPAPVEPSTPTETTMSKPIRPTKVQVTHAQFFKLCEWLKTADISTRFSYVEVARLASETLQFGVSPYAAENAMNTLEMKLVERPRSTSPDKDRVRILARALSDLMAELGKEVPADLLAITGRSQ